MSTIQVAGTSLQAAHDRAQPGDTLSLAAGGYAGFKWSKPLTIIGSGATIIEGPNSTIEATPTATSSRLAGVTVRGSTGTNKANILVRAPGFTIEDVAGEDAVGFIIRQYHADGLTLRRVTGKRMAAGIEVNRSGGLYAEDVTFSEITKMMVDTASGWGGDGFAFYGSTSACHLVRPTVIGARAKTAAASWKYDGSAFEAYGRCAPVVIEDWLTRDCVNIAETGTDSSWTDSTGPGIATGWVFRNGDAYANPGVAAPDDVASCVGYFLRPTKDWLWEGNRFHELDEYAFIVASGGTYGLGTPSGNVIRDNDFWLKPDQPESRYVVAGSTAGYSFDGNRVHYDPARTPGGVAYVAGQRISDLATFQAQTPWGDSDVWDANPDLPVDPCADVVAQLKVAQSDLATANGIAAQAIADRDTAQRAIVPLQAAVKRVQTDVAGL